MECRDIRDDYISTKHVHESKPSLATIHGAGGDIKGFMECRDIRDDYISTKHVHVHTRTASCSPGILTSL
ncbi:hypothetical protein E8M12_04860 [Thalassotalea mangrovi]|uniref:Uncharacterized protein n=1 Tax=Thalassotalea mangrovi TaxID=2572245 RepID=A0A4U1B724_9GAMM|nr:hypothetical protein E8M12_04860 [Thalassotalea mangrovi]